MSRTRAVLVATVVALLVTVVGAAPPTGAAAGEEYVALGDSFTAGPLLPGAVAPFGCLKSNRNFPHVAAASTGSTLVDASCSGATTDDLFAPQDVWPDGPNPAQLDALGPGTDIVTLQIGGNDIGFTEIIQECATYNPFATPCRDTYLAGGRDEIAARIDAAAPAVASALAQVAARAPGAETYVVGYPQILPSRGYGCWPSMPIGYFDIGYLRTKAEQLNTMLANQAAAAGATYVDTYAPSEGRSACASSGTRWVEPIVPANQAAPVHPNVRGMAGMGAIVAAATG